MNKLIITLTALSIAIAATIYIGTLKTEGLRIAIFLPAIHSAMDEIERGVKETMSQGNQKYTFTTYNAGGNKTLLNAQAEEIAHQQYDLVFTVGTACTQTMHTLITKKHLAMPLVFTAIENPASLGITQETGEGKTQVTGTYINDDFDKQIAYLLKVKPTTKNMLFVYDPTHGTGMDKVRSELTHVAQQKGLTLNTVEIFATHEIAQKVEPFMRDIDAILIYTDHTIVSGVDALIKLCNQYNVTLYASDLNSGEKGAALAFGVQEYEHGKQGALKALNILDDYQLASSVEITPISNYKLQINARTQEAQGLALTDEQLVRLQQDPHIIIYGAS